MYDKLGSYFRFTTEVACPTFVMPCPVDSLCFAQGVYKLKEKKN